MNGTYANHIQNIFSVYKLCTEAISMNFLKREALAQKREKLLLTKSLWTETKKAREWIDRGAPVEILNKSRVCEILGTDRYIGGQLDLRGGNVQPLSYVCGLARAGLELGAGVYAHTPVTGVSREKNDWRVDTPGGIVRSKFVLVCTNAYTDSLWPKLNRVIVPVSSFITATEPLPEALCHQILPNKNQVSETRRIPIYFLLTPGGHFVIGGRGNLFNTAQSGDTRHLQREAVRIYPQLTGMNWEFSWGGLVAATVNRVPRLFELGQNAYAGMAYNGRGVPMSTMMGKQLARLVCDEDVPMPLECPRPIKFHRFRQVGISLHLLTGPIFDRLL